MKRPLLAALLLAAAGCTKNGNQAPPKPADAPPAAAAKVGGARLDAARVIATWDGGQMTYGELFEKRRAALTKLERKYYQDLYAAEQREVEAQLLEMLIEKAAAAKGKKRDEYLQEIVRAAAVSDADILQFYEARVKATGEPLESAKPKIASYLMNAAQQTAMRNEFGRLLKEAKVEIDIPPPDGALARFDLGGRPIQGKQGAKVTIVEFSDFECPYCDRARGEIGKVVAAFPNDVAFYFLHFPLDMHQNARPAAIAAQCANLQGKFWELHDRLFEMQSSLSPETIAKLGPEIGLDKGRFDQCLMDPEVAKFVDADSAQGEDAGVEGTPSFFINGVHYSKGIPTVDDIKALIDAG
jgi:protein-disulfide isomerase